MLRRLSTEADKQPKRRRYDKRYDTGGWWDSERFCGHGDHGGGTQSEDVGLVVRLWGDRDSGWFCRVSCLGIDQVKKVFDVIVVFFGLVVIWLFDRGPV